MGEGAEMRLFAKRMRRFLDRPFKKGGTGPGGYDCLGLVAAVQDELGRRFPREYAGFSERDYWRLYEEDRERAEQTMIEFFDSFAPRVDARRLMPGDILVVRSLKNGWRFPAVYVGNGNCITSLADLGTRIIALNDSLPVVGAWRSE